jgi:hypothetical protein
MTRLPYSEFAEFQLCTSGVAPAEQSVWRSIDGPHEVFIDVLYCIGGEKIEDPDWRSFTCGVDGCRQKRSRLERAGKLFPVDAPSRTAYYDVTIDGQRLPHVMLQIKYQCPNCKERHDKNGPFCCTDHRVSYNRYGDFR